MKNFPALIFDNFYEKPDMVRDIALSLEYEDSDGRWPGSRTKNLKEAHPALYNLTIGKLLLLYYDIQNEDVDIDIDVMFQKIPSFHQDPFNVLNKGWIHSDFGTVAAGIVYLNKDEDLHCGTSIFRLKKEHSLHTYDELTSEDFISPKISFYKEKQISDDYEDRHSKNNDLFEETIRVNNIYNRLVFYDAQSFHAVNSYGITKEPFRLTQVFFIKKMNKTYPAQRSRKIYIK
jgi:hypothetical protein